MTTARSSSAAGSGARPRWPYRLFVVTLVAMLGWNLVGWVRNQVGFARDPRLEYSPRNIREVAWLNRNPRIAYRFAAFYLLAEHLAGTTLLTTRQVARQRFELERIARIHLEVVGGPLELDAAAAAALPGERVRFILLLRRDREPQVAELLVEPGARRYVLAEVPATGSLLILPEARYLAAGGANLMPR